MKIRNWLRRYLGITEVQEDQSHLSSTLRSQAIVLSSICRQLDTIVSGMGRVISKLDTMYAQPEIDNPERKAASDKLAEDTIARLTRTVQLRHRQRGR